MRHGSARVLQSAHPVPTLVGASAFNSTAMPSQAANAVWVFQGSTSAQGSMTVTANAGEIMAIIAGTGSYTQYPSSCTVTGPATLTPATTALQYAPNAACPITIWAFRVTTTGTYTITISITTIQSLQAGQYAHCSVSRWGNARLDATPVIKGAMPGAGLTQTSTIVPTHPQSIILWSAYDYTATSPAGTPTYQNGATQLFTPYVQPSVVAAYGGYQVANSLTAQTFGLTTTVSEQDTLGAVEIKPIAA